MNHKNTAQQLLTFRRIFTSHSTIYFWKFAEHIKLYQMDYLFLRSLVLENRNTFLDSWEKELENTRVNLREVSAPDPLSAPYIRQLKKFVQEAT